MSQKGKKSAGPAKGKKPAKAGGESKTEEVLQAVVCVSWRGIDCAWSSHH